MEIVKKSGPQRKCLTVSYEELATISQKTFNAKIWPFLELPAHSVTTMMHKQTSRPALEYIYNPHDIEPFLQNEELKIEF